MLNKMLAFLREQGLVQPGDRVICALSGGADSVAMTFAFYLLKEKLGITLEAAHFNHHLRGGESDRDEAFVRGFCDRYDIALHVGGGMVSPGEKGLEAAAREARYGFLDTLPGKIATAHTADDNGETVLLHLLRGTGLKGLGGIAPRRGKIIRPMLGVTRRDVELFLQEWCLPHVEDSSNQEDAFLRNRVRHHVMPLLYEENPRIGENLSRMALGLRLDEDYLSRQAAYGVLPDVYTLRAMHPAVRSRCLESFLKESGVREPEQAHLVLAEKLVFSENPSARAAFPGGVCIGRVYEKLEKLEKEGQWEQSLLSCPGVTQIPGFRVVCAETDRLEEGGDVLTVCPEGQLLVRRRRSGDAIRLPGGTRSLKKLFIDRKIPAAQRDRVPVLCDSRGILGVCSIGVNLDRSLGEKPWVAVRFIKTEN